MVIEVETLSSGIVSNRSRMSCKHEMDTPTLPTSPSLNGSSASRPSCVGKSKATESPFAHVQEAT